MAQPKKTKTKAAAKFSGKKAPAKKAAVKSSAAKSAKKPAKKFAAAKSVASKALAKKPVKKAPQIAAKPVAKAPRAAKPQKPARPYGMPEQMRDAALKVLDERQAEEVFTVDMAGKSSMADYLIIASGRASRQLSAIAHYLREAFEKLGLRNIRVEGLSDANWVLVDAGDVVVHLFRPEVRQYYDLEGMWNGKAKA